MPKRRAIWIFALILLFYPVSYLVIISTKEPSWHTYPSTGLNELIFIAELEWQPFSHFIDDSP
ncbi:hypothetical protein ACFQY0_14260 [Haloferula chungangensis]|uniref:ABC transporter permease n=1 Tax=Haloferula chungangensis TaxID=1048331 RepID=A0ABW2LAG7_9BACT